MKGTFVCVLVTLCILFSSCKNDRSVPLYNAWHELERTDFREGNEKFDHAVTAFKNELENEKKSFKYSTRYHENYMASFSDFQNWNNALDSLSMTFSTFEKSGKTEADYAQLRLSLAEKMVYLTWNYSKILLWANVIYIQLLVTFAIVTVICACIAVFYRYSVKRTKRESEDAIAVIHAQEAERQRISREIHDTVLQELNAQHLLLSKVCDNIESSAQTELTNVLFQMRTLTKNVAQRLRGICRNLVPPELEEGFLYDAVSLLCGSFAASKNIKCTYACENDARTILNSLSDQAKLNVYRLIQESLSNAANHSHAQETSVIIRLSSESDHAEKRIVVLVTDDGCGFDVKNALRSDIALSESGERIHLGLRGMYSRAAQLNGTLRIASSIGGGTSVRLEFPAQQV